MRRKNFLDLTQTQTKKCNFPEIECLAKLMIIISAKVQFQGFVQKNKTMILNQKQFSKKKFLNSHSLSADNQTRKPDLKK